MLEIENSLYDNGYSIIAGVDEAGRGPLAADVFAAAVILPKGLIIEGLNDSKKLSENKRDALYDEIVKSSIAFGVGRASAREIDEINILNATFLAMGRAIDNLSIMPDFVLIDGNMARNIEIEHKCVVKGDSLSLSIAAASIIAKVSRDRYMTELDKSYPQYGFAKHKGYGTKAHVEAIIEFGACIEHRESFLKKIR